MVVQIIPAPAAAAAAAIPPRPRFVPTAPPLLPRGVRNNNPGNIRRTASRIPWRGQSWIQDDHEFISFRAAEWGIRAIVCTLLTYQNKYGLHSAAGMIARWAPPVENRTSDYTDFVATWLGVPPDSRIEIRSWNVARKFVDGIIAEECAHHVYPSATVDEGLFLAGLTEL